MKVVVLCGGHGMRIRDVADDVPKPMIPVGPFPILWHVMKYYSHWGHNDFIICLGYKGRVIKDFFLNYEAHTRDFTVQLGGSRSIKYHSDHSEADWSVTLADTGIDEMTGARIKKVQSYLSDEDNFILTYGDGVADVDIHGLLEFHRSHGKILTVTGVRPPGRFGELVNNASGLVEEFNEKPQASGGRISGGFFVCRKELFEYLDNRKALVFEQDPMRKLVRDKQMMVYEHDGFWQCMDTNRDYIFLNSLYEKGEASWMLWK